MVVGTGKHFEAMSVHDRIRSIAPFVEFDHDRCNALRNSPSLGMSSGKPKGALTGLMFCIFVLFAFSTALYPACLAELPTLHHHCESANARCPACAPSFHCPRAFAVACFIDHRTRSAMNSAKGSIFMSMLARSSAAR